jgi:tripartite-type tricarboxylate transporter receptor subunit TctC
MAMYGALTQIAAFLRDGFSPGSAGEAARTGISAGRTTCAALYLTCAVAFLLPGVPQARAEQYPDRPIKLIVPYAAGGATDSFARLIGEHLGKALGKPFIIENRPGGATMTGTDAVAKAAPDGYTILIAGSSMTNVFLVYKDKVPYRMSEFAAIGAIAKTPLVVEINQALPVKTVGEFAAYAKANPSKLNYASFGKGTLPHLACEMVNQQMDIKMIDVPYRGSAPATTDLLGGQIQVFCDAVSTAVPLHEAGETRILGLMNEERIPLAKSIPTFRELGYPDLVASTTFGLLSPANTPVDIVARLSSELARIVKMPEVVARIEMLGSIPAPGTSADFDALIKRERDRWAKIAEGLQLTD